MLHIHYSKLDRGDMKAILSKRYDAEDTSAANQICIRRQESVSKTVVSRNFLWGGAWGMTFLAWWSVRRYNYHARLIALPFVFYGGTWVGRYLGDACCGRNAEYGRDAFLGALPAKVYYAP